VKYATAKRRKEKYNLAEKAFSGYKACFKICCGFYRDILYTMLRMDKGKIRI